MAGEWDSADPADLAGLLTAFANSMSELIPPALQHLRPLAVVRHPRSMYNSLTQARDNIAEHYDLSNDLFAEFLDETMTYSSALFDSTRPDWSELADAQHRKIDRLLDSARVGPGSRVLEIGTGWGELCIRAAARGAYVHSITLSAEQQRLAQQRVAEAGLSDRVLIELKDYREVDGLYDAVVSVEMIEAVGYRSGRRTSPRSIDWCRRADVSRSRRSPCRTTECWLPATRIPGFRSTSSQAD